MPATLADLNKTTEKSQDKKTNISGPQWFGKIGKTTERSENEKTDESENNENQYFECEEVDENPAELAGGDTTQDTKGGHPAAEMTE